MSPPRRPQAEVSEAILKAGGVALAGASLVFAFTMASSQGDVPRIVGLEHLAIYAQPARRSPAVSREPVRSAVDYTPVGSIRKGGVDAELIDYEILQAAQGVVVIRLPEGRVVKISAGSRIAGLGAVISVEKRKGIWSLVTEGGVISEASRNKPREPRRLPH